MLKQMKRRDSGGHLLEELVEKDAEFYPKMKSQAKKTRATDERFKDLGKKRAEAERQKRRHQGEQSKRQRILT